MKFLLLWALITATSAPPSGQIVALSESRVVLAEPGAVSVWSVSGGMCAPPVIAKLSETVVGDLDVVHGIAALTSSRVVLNWQSAAGYPGFKIFDSMGDVLTETYSDEDFFAGDIEGLSSDSLVFVDREGEDVIERYEWDGVYWDFPVSELLTGPALPTVTTTGAYIAVANYTDKSLQAYSIGSLLPVGAPLSVPYTQAKMAVSGLPGQKVAMLRGRLDGAGDLVTYEFDGANWSELPGSLVIGATGASDIAALPSGRVVVLTSGQMRLYE